MQGMRLAGALGETLMCMTAKSLPVWIGAGFWKTRLAGKVHIYLLGGLCIAGLKIQKHRFGVTRKLEKNLEIVRLNDLFRAREDHMESTSSQLEHEDSPVLASSLSTSAL
jgi:uncharacterized protein YbaP (TraB family)